MLAIIIQIKIIEILVIIIQTKITEILATIIQIRIIKKQVLAMINIQLV